MLKFSCGSMPPDPPRWRISPLCDFSLARTLTNQFVFVQYFPSTFGDGWPSSRLSLVHFKLHATLSHTTKFHHLSWHLTKISTHLTMMVVVVLLPSCCCHIEYLYKGETLWLLTHLCLYHAGRRDCDLMRQCCKETLVVLPALLRVSSSLPVSAHF